MTDNIIQELRHQLAEFFLGVRSCAHCGRRLRTVERQRLTCRVCMKELV